jgi:nitrogen-specific signal transduction histidine kinase
MRIEQSEFHDHLVRGLTHEMNNILSLFHGYLGIMLDDKKLDKETHAGLLRIRDSADAASRLIDRTKNLAPPAPRQHREIVPEEFLRSLMPSLQLIAEPYGIRIESDCDSGLQPILGDTSRLRVALKEIVKNACEASPAHGVVRLSVKPHPRPGRASGRRVAAPAVGWTAICVTDSGTGIPGDLSQKIYQPFFSTKKNADCVGLGLSVALGLIQQLGGAIRLRSRPGRTTFKVLLPCGLV